MRPGNFPIASGDLPGWPVGCAAGDRYARRGICYAGQPCGRLSTRGGDGGPPGAFGNPDHVVDGRADAGQQRQWDQRNGGPPPVCPSTRRQSISAAGQRGAAFFRRDCYSPSLVANIAAASRPRSVSSRPARRDVGPATSAVIVPVAGTQWGDGGDRGHGGHRGRFCRRCWAEASLSVGAAGGRRRCRRRVHSPGRGLRRLHGPGGGGDRQPSHGPNRAVLPDPSYGLDRGPVGCRRAGGTCAELVHL